MNLVDPKQGIDLPKCPFCGNSETSCICTTSEPEIRDGYGR